MKFTRQQPNEALHQQRQLRGWSQAKLAELIGTSHDQISRWETGKRFPLPFFQEKLCLVFAMNAQQLGFVEPLAPSRPEESSPPAHQRQDGSHPLSSELQDQERETLPKEAEEEPEDHPLPGPTFRIWLCGPFAGERRVAERYELLSPPEWGGTNYSRLLLKVLLCSPGRHARRDVLLERLWPEGDPEYARQCLNSATTKLREALRPGKEQESLLMSESNATVYRLPSQDVLWTDVDAALTLVEEAERLGRLTPSALPLLEEAAEYFHRGAFLEEEEGLWLSSYRASIERARVRTRLWLSEAYMQQGRLGQAETVLNVLLEEDPTDEEVVGRLMALLAQQGMTYQALRLYKQTCEHFEQEGLKPSKAMKHLNERIGSLTELPSHVIQLRQKEHLSEQQETLFPTGLDSIQFLSLLPILSSQPGTVSFDVVTWFGMQVSELKAFGSFWQRSIVTRQQQQAFVYAKLKNWRSIIDQKQQSTNEYLVSRRTALATLATLSSSLLAKMQYGPLTPFVIEEFIAQCATSITTCWHLLNEDGLALATQVLPVYLPLLDALTQHPSPYRREAAYLAAQGNLLKGILALHQVDFAAREGYCQAAKRYSILSEEYNIQAATYMHLGCTLYYGNEQDATKALHIFQQALPLLEEVSPLLRSCIHMRLAMALARCHQEKEAVTHIRTARELFPEHPEDDPSFPYAEYGLPNMHLVEGIAYLDLGKYSSEKSYAQQAWNAFSSVRDVQLPSRIPERNYFQIVNYQAKAAIALGDLEQFCHLLAQGVQGAKRLRSQMRQKEAIAIYWQGRKTWPNDSRVKELADIFVQETM